MFNVVKTLQNCFTRDTVRTKIILTAVCICFTTDVYTRFKVLRELRALKLDCVFLTVLNSYYFSGTFYFYWRYLSVDYCVRFHWRWGRFCPKVSEKFRSTLTYVTTLSDCRECLPEKCCLLNVSKISLLLYKNVTMALINPIYNLSSWSIATTDWYNSSVGYYITIFTMYQTKTLT